MVITQFSVHGLAAMTMEIFNVMCQVAPDCGTPEEVGQIVDQPAIVCKAVLDELATAGWIRETKDGFQTVGQRIQRLDDHSHRVLDGSFADKGLPLPKRKLADGSWTL